MCHITWQANGRALRGRWSGKAEHRPGRQVVRRHVTGSREPAGLADRGNCRIFCNGIKQRRQFGAQCESPADRREPAQQLQEGVLERIQRGIDIG